ncbi:MAG: cupin domain-containing protein [Candidatus Velamenicoccus archaeovorus]
MEIARGNEGTYRQGEGDRFTGTVWLRTTIADPTGTNVGVVTFGPGARTHWHRHPGGQFLFGLAGRGRVRTRGERGHVLEPGDVVHVGADEWHFHGGTPEAPMTHVAVNGGGAPEWGDPVTDEEYAEGF